MKAAVFRVPRPALVQRLSGVFAVVGGAQTQVSDVFARWCEGS